jgi:hypothetical protein
MINSFSWTVIYMLNKEKQFNIDQNAPFISSSGIESPVLGMIQLVKSRVQYVVNRIPYCSDNSTATTDQIVETPVP